MRRLLEPTRPVRCRRNGASGREVHLLFTAPFVSARLPKPKSGLWKSRGAEFITEPIPKYGGTRCYIRDPDGYIIEIGQSTDLTYG
jgi:catechol 2,3-dioxygenase-like lactoylglutathione lyase family enzyme